MNQKRPRHVRRRLAAIAVAGAVFAGSSMAPAFAAKSDCPSTYFCWWESANFNNRWYASQNNMMSWNTIPDWSSFNNGTSGNAVRVYSIAGYINQRYCLRRGTAATSAGGGGNGHQWNAATSECL